MERRDVLSGVPLTSFGFDFRFRQPIAGNDFNLEAKTEMAYAATEVRFYWDANHNSIWDPSDNLLSISSFAANPIDGSSRTYAYIPANQYASLFGVGPQTFFAFTGEMPMAPSMIRSDTVTFVAADSPTIISKPTNPITVTPGNTIDFASLSAITVDDPDVPSDRLMNVWMFPSQAGHPVDSGVFTLSTTQGLEVTNVAGFLDLIGTETAINNALRTMQFKPDPFLAGSFELELYSRHIVSQNFTGSQQIYAAQTIPYSVQPLSGVPQIQAPTMVTKSESSPWTVFDFRQAQGTAIRITDSDAVTTKYQVLLETDVPMEMYFATVPGSISGVVVNLTQAGSGAGFYRQFLFTADTLALANQVLESLSVRVPVNYVSGRLKLRATEIPPVGSPVVGLERRVLIESVGPNTPPQLTVNLSPIAAADHDEDESFTFGSGAGHDFTTQWYISDPDVKQEDMWFRLSTNGIGTLTLLDPVVTLQGSNGTSEIILIGSENNIEATLNRGIRYTPPLNYFGPTPSDLVTLSFDVSDLGHSGTGIAGTDSTSVSFHVDSINDRPFVTGPGVQEIFVNSSFTFSADRGTALKFTDADSTGTFSAEITVPVAAIDGDGDLILTNSTGVTMIPKTTGLVLQGTRENVIAALDGLKVVPDTNFVGSTTVQLSVVEGTSSIPAQSATGTSRITTPIRVVLFQEKFDAFLLLDDTVSFSTPNTNLQNSIPQLFNELVASFGTLDFLGLGIGRFEEYGQFEDAFTSTATEQNLPFILNQPIITQDTVGSVTAFANAIRSALLRRADGSGGDLQESLAEALFQVATGLGFDGNGDTDKTDSGNAGTRQAQNIRGTQANPIPSANTDVPTYQSLDLQNLQGGMLPPAAFYEDGTIGRGGAGFRQSSIPLIIAATDNGTRFEEEGGATPVVVSRLGDQVEYEGFTQNGISGTPFDSGASVTDALSALAELHPLTTVVGLGRQNVEETMLRAFARATGAVNKTGVSIPRGQGQPAVPNDGGQQDGSLYLPFNISDSGSYASAIGDAIRAGVRLHATMPLNLIYGAPAMSLFTTGMTGVNASTVPVRSTSTAINVSHASIPAGTPAAVFQTVLSGTSSHVTPSEAEQLRMSYNVPNGTYSVELYFAEIEGQAAGQRKFNIAIEGQNKESNFDVAAAAGGLNRGIVRTFNVTVTDGHLNIDLTRVLGSAPIISGLRLLATAPRVTDVIISTSGPTHRSQSYAAEIAAAPADSGVQLRTALVGNPNVVEIRFDKLVDVQSTDLTIRALSFKVNRDLVTPPALKTNGFTPPSANNNDTARWEFATAFPVGQYVLSLKDHDVTGAGMELDGEWVNPHTWMIPGSTPQALGSNPGRSSFPSGDGEAGGDFNFVFTYALGIDNAVANADLTLLLDHWGDEVSGPEQGDFDGSGVVGNGDLTLLLDNWGIDLNLLRIWDLVGDDFEVTQEDIDLVTVNRNHNPSSFAGDLNGDGIIDNDDVNLINNYRGLKYSYVK